MSRRHNKMPGYGRRRRSWSDRNLTRRNPISRANRTRARRDNKRAAQERD